MVYPEVKVDSPKLDYPSENRIKPLDVLQAIRLCPENPATGMPTNQQ